jgi:hypothetical protein
LAGSDLLALAAAALASRASLRFDERVAAERARPSGSITRLALAWRERMAVVGLAAVLVLIRAGLGSAGVWVVPGFAVSSSTRRWRTFCSVSSDTRRLMAAAAAGMGGALLGNRWEIVGTFRREGLLSKAPPS